MKIVHDIVLFEEARLILLLDLPNDCRSLIDGSERLRLDGVAVGHDTSRESDGPDRSSADHGHLRSCQRLLRRVEDGAVSSFILHLLPLVEAFRILGSGFRMSLFVALEIRLRADVRVDI